MRELINSRRKGLALPSQTVKLKPIDLCPKKPDPKYLAVDGTVATVDITVTTKSKPIPSVVLKRLEQKVVPAEVERYKKIIQEETLILEKKIKALAAKGDENAMKQMVADTQTSIRNATKGLQGAVNVAMAKQLKEDAKADRDLLEAQVVAVLKGLLITLKIGISVAKLAVSHGADVTAYVSLAKGALEMAKLVAAALASEAKVRGEYMTAIGKYKVAVATASPSNKQKLDAKLDELRRAHKNKVTGLRQDLEKLSLRSDELMKKAKAAKTLKNGVQLGAKSFEVKRKVDVKLKDYLEIETLAEQLTAAAKNAGAQFDERSLVQRLTISDLKAFAEEMKGIIEDIIDLAAA